MFGQHGEMGVLWMLKMETLKEGMVEIEKIVNTLMHGEGDRKRRS